jgi:hemolysin activation/secretion protein
MNFSKNLSFFNSRATSIHLLSWAALFAFSNSAHAAEVEAGSLQQQIDRNQTFKLPKQALPLLPKPIVNKPDSGLKILIKNLKVQGNTLLDDSHFHPLLTLYQNKEMSFAKIENVVSDVAELYRKSGWTVKAYLPEQDVQDGQVVIQIVEARLGRVLMDGDVPSPATAESIQKIIQARQASGEFLNGTVIDRALLIANDISGVYITGNLTEGSAETETDLILKAAAKPSFDGNWTMDNTGSRGTGGSRFAYNLNLNSLVQVGDQLSGNTIQTEASQYLRFGWKVPVGLDGWTVGASMSQMRYRALQFQETVAPTGTSDTQGLEGVYPVIRSRSKNLYLSLALEDKRFLNYSEGQTKSDYSSRLRTLSFYGNSFDELGGGGANSGSISFVNGYLNLDQSPNASEIATTTLTAGSFNKIRYALNRQQMLTSELSLMGSISGQVSRGGKNPVSYTHLTLPTNVP